MTMNASPYGLFLTAPRELELRPLVLPPLKAGEGLVRVAGCGLCHTDIGFYTARSARATRCRSSSVTRSPAWS